MRTSQLYAQDNNNSLTHLHSQRFDSCKSIASKRQLPVRPMLANPTLKNHKHAAVLAENGISYDAPLTPIQVAQIRADRIAKEKKVSDIAAAVSCDVSFVHIWHLRQPVNCRPLTATES